MKFYWLKYVLFLAVAAFLAWGGYELCVAESMKWAMAVTVFATFAFGSAVLCFEGLSHGCGGNVKALAVTYLAISLVMNFIYTFLEFSVVGLVVPNGLLLLLALIVGRAVIKADV